jgi:hypothetical protein
MNLYAFLTYLTAMLSVAKAVHWEPIDGIINDVSVGEWSTALFRFQGQMDPNDAVIEAIDGLALILKARVDSRVQVRTMLTRPDHLAKRPPCVLTQSGLIFSASCEYVFRLPDLPREFMLKHAGTVVEFNARVIVATHQRSVDPETFVYFDMPNPISISIPGTALTQQMQIEGISMRHEVGARTQDATALEDETGRFGQRQQLSSREGSESKDAEDQDEEANDSMGSLHSARSREQGHITGQHEGSPHRKRKQQEFSRSYDNLVKQLKPLLDLSDSALDVEVLNGVGARLSQHFVPSIFDEAGSSTETQQQRKLRLSKARESALEQLLTLVKYRQKKRQSRVPFFILRTAALQCSLIKRKESEGHKALLAKVKGVPETFKNYWKHWDEGESPLKNMVIRSCSGESAAYSLMVNFKRVSLKPSSDLLNLTFRSLESFSRSLKTCKSLIWKQQRNWTKLWKHTTLIMSEFGRRTIHFAMVNFTH